MPLPFRFVVTTYNIWADNRWPEREEAMREFLRAHRPDVLCLQELRLVTRQVIDEELQGHQRIDDPFEGWTGESNIYWSAELFDKIEHGHEMAGMELYCKFRHVFWVRLRVKNSDKTVLVATAHFTWQSHPQEVETSKNPRRAEAHATVAILDKLAKPGEPVIFMGDLNDSVAVPRIFTDAGYQNDCQALGKLPSITWPAFLTARNHHSGSLLTPQVIDWQWHRGPIGVMNSSVTDFFPKDIPPSDHKPVTVTYTLK